MGRITGSSTNFSANSTIIDTLAWACVVGAKVLAKVQTVARSTRRKTVGILGNLGPMVA